MRFSSFGFLHESIEPRPQSHTLTSFRNLFRFREVIHKKGFFRKILLVMIPSEQYSENICLPGIVTRKIFVHRVTIPGNVLKKTTLVNTPWNLDKIQQIFLAKFYNFPGIVTQIIFVCWVTIPGSRFVLHRKFLFWHYRSVISPT